MAPMDSDWAIAVGESKEFAARAVGGVVDGEELRVRHLGKLLSAGSKLGDSDVSVSDKEAK